MIPLDGIAGAIGAVAADIKPYIDEKFQQAHQKDADLWRQEFSNILLEHDDDKRADLLLPFVLRLLSACGEVTGGIGNNTERLIQLRISHFTAFVNISVKYDQLVKDFNALRFQKT